MSQPSLSGQSPDLALDEALAVIARIIEENSVQIDETGGLVAKAIGTQCSPELARNLQNLDRLSQKNKAAAEALRTIIRASQKMAHGVWLRSDSLDAALHLEDFAHARDPQCAMRQEARTDQRSDAIELF